MLRDIPKPPVEVSNILNPGTETASADVSDDVPRTPTTLVTLVTIEALTSLYDLITKDTYVLKKTSKDRL